MKTKTSKNIQSLCDNCFLIPICCNRSPIERTIHCSIYKDLIIKNTMTANNVTEEGVKATLAIITRKYYANLCKNKK